MSNQLRLHLQRATMLELLPGEMLISIIEKVHPNTKDLEKLQY